MEYLAREGYTVVRLGDVQAMLNTPVNGDNGKYVAITFDDGFADFHTHAYPILEKFGHAATVFLPTAFISDDQGEDPGREYLTWQQVRALAGKGVEFGSHTVTHRQLRSESTKEIENELRNSREEINKQADLEVKYFSYPYAFPDDDDRFKENLQRILTRSGYEIGVSTRIGCAARGDNPFYIKRLPVNSFDDIAFFKAKLEGAYDWLHAVQYASKSFRNRLKGKRTKR